jgi:hypothetical protein
MKADFAIVTNSELARSLLMLKGTLATLVRSRESGLPITTIIALLCLMVFYYCCVLLYIPCQFSLLASGF